MLPIRPGGLCSYLLLSNSRDNDTAARGDFAAGIRADQVQRSQILPLAGGEAVSVGAGGGLSGGVVAVDVSFGLGRIERQYTGDTAVFRP